MIGFQQLQTYFNRYASFKESEIEAIYAQLELRTYVKDDFLLREGQNCPYKFFITKGLTRSYYLNTKGIERVVLFAIENWWVTNLESFICETPSLLNIQALEETIVLRIRKTDLEELYHSIPKLERVFRIMTENMLIAIERRSEFFMKASGEDRYYNIMTKLPQLLHRIPQYMIASYLDMTPEHLSAIRKKVAENRS